MRGLNVSIYRGPYPDCSNRGPSSQYKYALLVSPDGSGPHELNRDSFPVKLVHRMIGGKPYVHAEPIGPEYDGRMLQAGGTFIYSSDSRFPSQYPISLHDRME